MDNGSAGMKVPVLFFVDCLFGKLIQVIKVSYQELLKMLDISAIMKFTVNILWIRRTIWLKYSYQCLMQ